MAIRLRHFPVRHLFGKRNMYRQVIQDTSTAQQRKDKHLYLAHFDITTHFRSSIPNGPPVSLETYYRNMAQSKFVFSPNGDRPECYRHYEAIGLGAVPITQLDPWIHRHLQGNIVFNNTIWNVSYFWNSSSRVDGYQYREPNREMAFEDYWKLYAEREVNRSLNWAPPNIGLDDTVITEEVKKVDGSAIGVISKERKL